jgi:hypothetical protein
MMYRRLAVVVLLIGLLPACTNPREALLARDRQDCVGFGFQPGTREYSECLLRLNGARQSSLGHAHGHHY